MEAVTSLSGPASSRAAMVEAAAAAAGGGAGAGEDVDAAAAGAGAAAAAISRHRVKFVNDTRRQRRLSG